MLMLMLTLTLTLMLMLTLMLTLMLMLMLMLTLTLRQTQRAIHGLRWLKIYMALTTTMLCENMSSVRLTLMLSQLGLCKTTVYTEASEYDGFSKKINESKLPDEHCKAGKTKKSNANGHQFNTIGMILFKFGSIDQNKTLSN